MKQTSVYIAGAMLLLSVVGCTFDQPSEPEAVEVEESLTEMVKGRWASVDRSMLALVDLDASRFMLMQHLEFGWYPAINAANIKIIKEQQNPKQLTLTFDVNDKHSGIILRIIDNDDDTYYLTLVNPDNGFETELNYVSDDTDFKSLYK
ncbi:MAG: hypothetical protein Q9M75_08460 [Ghiorsea sp.]|nr:hypothetical protein [Ghiorsea sp.]